MTEEKEEPSSASDGSDTRRQIRESVKALASRAMQRELSRYINDAIAQGNLDMMKPKYGDDELKLPNDMLMLVDTCATCSRFELLGGTAEHWCLEWTRKEGER